MKNWPRHLFSLKNLKALLDFLCCLRPCHTPKKTWVTRQTGLKTCSSYCCSTGTQRYTTFRNKNHFNHSIASLTFLVVLSFHLLQSPYWIIVSFTNTCFCKLSSPETSWPSLMACSYIADPAATYQNKCKVAVSNS